MRLPDSDLNALLRLTIAGQDELASALIRDLSNGVYAHIPDQEFIDAAVAAIQNQTAHYADLLADSALAAYLVAQQKLATKYIKLADDYRPGGPVNLSLDWQGNLAWLPIINNAAEELSSRQVFSRSAFDALDSQTRRNAFTVAGIRSEKTIEKVRDHLAQAVRDGLGYRSWNKIITEDLDESFLSRAHGENVFRTNIAKAVNRGTEKILEDPLVGEAFPFVENIYADDTRLSDLCYGVSRSGIDGTAIYLRDDPFWRDFAPPRHWNCRCKASYLTVKQAAAKGISYAQKWLELERRPNERGWVRNPGLSLPKGWEPSSLV